MRELRQWMQRLATVGGAEPPNSGSLRPVMHRVAAPSRLDFDNSVVRVVDTGAEVELFGTLPSCLSLLCWADLAEHADHLGDIAVATQLGAVMTMATNRRVRVASAETSIHMEGTQSYTFLPAVIVDRELAGPLPEDAKERIEALLQRIIGLEEPDLVTIGNALDLHYASVLLHDVDLNAAYALAVAGIETLAQRYGTTSTDWGHWDQAPRFDAAFDAAGLTDDQRISMRDALLHERHLGLRQRFASYVCDRLPPTWWTTTVQDYIPSLEMQPTGMARLTGQTPADTWPIDQFVPRDAATLRRRVLATYDARSSYVHVGGRSVSAMTTMSAAIGDQAPAKTPLDFIGLRRILCALIDLELADRAELCDLPALRLLHDAPD